MLAELKPTRLAAAMEAIPDGLCIYDADDRLIYFNQRYREVYPMHATVLELGAKFEDMLRIGVERGEFPDAIGREEDWIATRLEQHQNPKGPIEQRLAGGRWLRIEEKRTKDGDIVGLRSDITSFKHAEARYKQAQDRFRDFADAAGDWLWETDADLRFTYFSDNVERIVGVVPEWHYGKTREDILGKEADKDHWRAHLEDLRNHRPFRDFEYYRVGPGIAPRWLRTSGKPYFDEDGIFVGYRGCGSDITEQKEAEERLRISEAKLLASQKMEAIGRLTGGVAHDFNNIMQVIMGNAELLAFDPNIDRECVEAIVRATQRGSELTGRLLAYARRQTLAPQIIDLEALAGDAAKLLRRALGEAIEITVSCEVGLWAVYADPDQLETALLNLALNAREAMPKGGALEISCRNARVEEDHEIDALEVLHGEYVLLSVRDTGTGMTPEVKRRAVEPFFTTKEVGEGSGLGLSMVYGYAKQSRGHLTIESAEGAGTTVNLFLPRSETPNVAVADRRAAPVAEGQGELILVLEDDPDVRYMTVRMLRTLNYRVIEAGTAMEALGLLSVQTDIDLVLSDIGLPGGMDGYDFAAEARARYPGIRLAFISGYPASNLPDASASDTGITLLTKPFGKRELSALVRKLLETDTTGG